MKQNDRNDAGKQDVFAGIDATKRKTLTRLIGGSAFVAPIIASFAMDALSVSNAQAKPAYSTIPICDRRLKTGVVPLGTLPSGLELYRFKYLWSDIEYVGVMAQEVREVMPEAVVEGAGGFLRVDFAALGLEMVTYADWQKGQASGAAAAA